MSDPANADNQSYRPDYVIDLPPVYAWPPKIGAIVKYLTVDLLFPWGYMHLGLAMLCWTFFTPSLESLSELSPGWMAMIWLRNIVLLTMLAGGLHWWLYIRKSQGTNYKFDRRWLATEDSKFLWGDQVKDNMFWSLASGVTVWSLYESVTLWIYASGQQPIMSISGHPVYFVFSIYLLYAWSTTNFYFVHRFLHFKPVYDLAHERHHRNVNIGPWTGISMHPVEHVLYFSVFVLWWFVPVHPVIILMTGFFQGLNPAISHSGFDFFATRSGRGVTVGDYFHQLHHKYFHVNYGNTPTPYDKVFGSWHDGSDAGKAVVKSRLKKQSV